MNSPIARRIAGTATLIAVIAFAALGFQYRFARQEGSTDIFLAVSEAGIGTQPGTDVKVRGVTVGEVVDVTLDDDTGLPRLHTRLDPGVQVPVEGLEVSITPKTFFGEKQVVLSYPLEAYEEPPFLEDGDVVAAEGGLTEVEDVLQTLQPLLSGIDEGDLATLFDATAELEGEGETIARTLEVNAELARFGNSIRDDALRNMRLLTSFSNQLARGADEFDRLNRQLPAAVAVISERADEIDTNLEALSSFALTAANWIDVEEDRWDRLFATGDVVGAFLERNVDSIDSIIEGVTIFAEAQSRPSPYLDDGTIYVPFKIFLLLDEGLEGLLGPLFGPLTSAGGQ